MVSFGLVSVCSLVLVLVWCWCLFLLCLFLCISFLLLLTLLYFFVFFLFFGLVLQFHVRLNYDNNINKCPLCSMFNDVNQFGLCLKQSSIREVYPLFSGWLAGWMCGKVMKLMISQTLA